MRRPAIRFLLTLVTAASILGVVPATSEAGIIPWAWDTVFGPVGSIQARRAARYCGTNDCGVSAGCYYGPSPGLFGGLRGWRNRACCGTYGYGSYGGSDCSSCGTNCGGSCNTGCSTCGVGSGGYDSGYVYGSAGCGPGGCSTGQCNVNYPPGNSSGSGVSPVTPAPAPGGGTSGPVPNYDNTPGANAVVPPAAPGAATDDGFVPRGGNNKSPAPPTGDPNQDEKYIPPKVNPPEGANSPVDANGNSTTVPPVTPNKKPVFGEDDEKGGALGPRLELQEKITWQPSVVRVRMAQTPVRVSATANRHGMFPKIAWRSGSDTELAKK